MMIVDLIDEIDFKERLQQWGFDISIDDTLEVCFQKVLLADNDSPDSMQRIIESVSALVKEGFILHPDVKAFVDQLKTS